VYNLAEKIDEYDNFPEAIENEPRKK